MKNDTFVRTSSKDVYCNCLGIVTQQLERRLGEEQHVIIFIERLGRIARRVDELQILTEDMITDMEFSDPQVSYCEKQLEMYNELLMSTAATNNEGSMNIWINIILWWEEQLEKCKAGGFFEREPQCLYNK